MQKKQGRTHPKGKKTVVVVEFLSTEAPEEESGCKKVYVIKSWEIGEQIELFTTEKNNKKSRPKEIP